MRMSKPGLGVGLAIAAALSVCCATPQLPAVALDLFVPASSDDPWSDKIRNWQVRHGLDPAQHGEPAGTPSTLADEYRQFSLELRRKIVARTVAWVQEQSQRIYRPDGDHDHWATLGEVIEKGGDDCDGLDLLTFVLLRRLGFEESEIYRSIVVERRTGQHHMVTLWFDTESRENPFVLDPTGVVTSEMVRLAEVPGWDPIELFDERVHYRVELAVASGAVSGN